MIRVSFRRAQDGPIGSVEIAETSDIGLPFAVLERAGREFGRNDPERERESAARFAEMMEARREGKGVGPGQAGVQVLARRPAAAGGRAADEDRKTVLDLEGGPPEEGARDGGGRPDIASGVPGPAERGEDPRERVQVGMEPAASTASQDAAGHRERVVDYLRGRIGDATSGEIAQALGIDEGVALSVATDLMISGALSRTTKRKCRVTGAMAVAIRVPR